MASSDQPPCWRYSSLLPYSSDDGVHGPQYTATHHQERFLSNGRHHPASSNHLTHSILLPCSSSTRVALLEKIWPSDRLWALQQRSHRSSPSPHEGNQKESVENRSIRDVLATARTLNPTKMTWRLFCGISEYTRSPLTDTKPVVEEDVILGHIIELHTILMSIIQRANASHVTTYILTPNRLGAIGNPSSTDMVSLQF